MNRIIGFIKKDPVLAVAWVLAIVSMFIVTPDMEYVGYIDVRTLAILFCLMCVVAGFKDMGLFDAIAMKMINASKHLVQIVIVLVLMCFFFSMVITNDVALITFVPLTMIIVNKLDIMNKEAWIILTVVLQTVAANLGSCFTPIGNPQNLYLYGISGMSMKDFVVLMFPVMAISLVIICVMIAVGSVRLKGLQAVDVSLSRASDNVKNEYLAGIDTRKRVIYYAQYTMLFVLCLGAVARLINIWSVVALVILAFAFSNPGVFRKVDYNLLVTFVGFFIFVGNMGRIEVFRDFLAEMIAGREVVTAIITSQVTSNVPAALLLSGFTDNVEALIIGTNIGGLGTLIASMASLISFKYVSKEYPKLKGRYLFVFTLINVIMLALISVIWII